MTKPIHIAGDGVAGLSLARELTRRGAHVVVHGDGRARAPIFTLVHRYAGRSFRTKAFDDAVWHAASSWLDTLVADGVVTRHRMVRPRSSRAGDRLASSLEHAENVRIEHVEPHGDCFVYEPAYVVDVARTLDALAAPLDVRDGRRHDDAVFATGASFDHPGVEKFGGHLVRFEGSLDVAVSGGGVHAVPTPDGVCVGSTWFEPDEPLEDAAAAAELRERAEKLGLAVGRAQHIWQGFRAVYQADRRPLVGELDDRFVVAAFGTRGWYWAAYAAQQAADALLDRREIDPAVDARRARQT